MEAGHLEGDVECWWCELLAAVIGPVALALLGTAIVQFIDWWVR